MDWEAPVDAWSVWLAVALVSIAVAGVVLSFPTGPPPDANQAANAIERTTEVYTTPVRRTTTTPTKSNSSEPPSRCETNTGRHTRVSPTERSSPCWGDDRLERIAHGASLEAEYGYARQSDRRDVGGEFR